MNKNKIIISKKATLGLIGAFILSTSLIQLNNSSQSVEQDIEPSVIKVASVRNDSELSTSNSKENTSELDKQLLENMMAREKPFNVASRAGRPSHLENKASNEIKSEASSIDSLAKETTETVENIKPKLPIEEVAKLTIEGKYGNGEIRKINLEKEGYDYTEVQNAVKEILPKPSPKPNIPQNVDNQSTQNVANTGSMKSNVIQAYPHKTFKSYMSWTALSASSPQGKLAAKSSPDPTTEIMKYNGRYLVALGFAYADYIGQEIDIVMKSGQVIPVIVGDWKAKAHTDQWNSASLNNGSIIEFIVASNSEAARATKGSGSYNSIFSGEVKEFRK